MKEKGALLIAIVMVLSTVAVTADTEDDVRIRNRQNSFTEVGCTYIESDPIAYLHNRGPVIFDQQPIPDDNGGHGPFSDAGSGGGPYRVYENFWGLTENIYDVHWWGLWGHGSGSPTVGDEFEISFCADNGGIPNYNNHIVDFTGSIGTEITYVGTGNFYWGYELYYMEMDLPVPVSMASGWVSFYKTTINAQKFAMIDALTGDDKTYQLNYGILPYDVSFELTSAANPPPETPSKPLGPSNGVVEVEYTFYTSTTDPEGEQVFYLWDWDDGTASKWIGPYDSGAKAQANHSWAEEGDYNITVRAKDISDMESGLSDPLAIHIVDMPILEIGNITGGIGKISIVIKNTGSMDAIGVDWNLTLNGGFILLGKGKTGRIGYLPAHGEISISSDLIIGFGKTVVTVCAEIPESSDTKEQNAFVFLFFIKI